MPGSCHAVFSRGAGCRDQQFGTTRRQFRHPGCEQHQPGLFTAKDDPKPAERNYRPRRRADHF